jgi:DNA-binding PadR family transcriptional regulator
LGKGEPLIPNTSVTPKEIFLSEVKSKTVFPLLVLHMLRQRPEYGNRIIKRMGEITDGAMTVSPNTIYPLLRRLEEKGYIVGEWENPDSKSRRFYSITPSGEEKYEEVKGLFEEHLFRVKRAIESLQKEIYG